MQEKIYEHIKNSPWLIVMRFFQAIKTSWVVVGALLALYPLVHEYAHFWVCMFSAYYAWTRIYVVFYDWIAWRYRVSSEGITARSGIFSRTTQFIAWRDVVSVASKFTPIMQWKYLTNVIITPQGAGENAIELFAIKNDEAARINTYFSFFKKSEYKQFDAISKISPVSHSDFSLSVMPVSRNVNALKVRIKELHFTDCFFLALSKLAFLSAIPMSYGIFNVLSRNQGYSDDIFVLIKDFFAFDFYSRLYIACAVICIALIVGSLLVWITYGNSSTDVYENSVKYTSGIFTQTEQEIPISSIETIKVRQNLLMRLLKRNYIAVYGVSAHMQEEFSGVIAHFAKEEDAEKILQQFGIEIPNYADLPRHRYLLAALCIAAGVGICAFLTHTVFFVLIIIFCIAIFLFLYCMYYRKTTKNCRWDIVCKSFLGTESLFLRKDTPYPLSQYELKVHKKILMHYEVVRYLGKIGHQRIVLGVSRSV